jgi:hypothetical protein
MTYPSNTTLLTTARCLTEQRKRTLRELKIRQIRYPFLAHRVRAGLHRVGYAEIFPFATSRSPIFAYLCVPRPMCDKG